MTNIDKHECTPDNPSITLIGHNFKYLQYVQIEYISDDLQATDMWVSDILPVIRVQQFNKSGIIMDEFDIDLRGTKTPEYVQGSVHTITSNNSIKGHYKVKTRMHTYNVPPLHVSHYKCNLLLLFDKLSEPFCHILKVNRVIVATL